MTEYLCTTLKHLIEEHHRSFLLLYGDQRFTPMFHYLLHYPTQIIATGPMIRTWTIRYETKLNCLKQCSHLANFNNVALSLANRHQRWMCYEMSSEYILHSELECGPSSPSSLLKNEPLDIHQALLCLFPNTSLENTITRPKWIKYLGTLYKANNAYIILKSDGLDPVFAKLTSITVIGSDLVMFDIMLCNTLYFNDHYFS